MKRLTCPPITDPTNELGLGFLGDRQVLISNKIELGLEKLIASNYSCNRKHVFDGSNAPMLPAQQER
jgi:hypothetical protein